MFELMKIVGVSAVLSAGLVTASEMQGQEVREPASAKIYTDRLPQGEAVPSRALRITYVGEGESREGSASQGTKGDRLKAPQGACAAQAWPHVAPECVAAASGAPVRSVRMITVEQREGANTSVLVRVPTPALAQR